MYGLPFYFSSNLSIEDMWNQLEAQTSKCGKITRPPDEGVWRGHEG